MKNKPISIVIAVLVLAGVVWFLEKPKHAVAPGDTLSPTPTATVSTSPSVSPKAPAITITSPKANEAIDLPVTVKGYATGVFENTLSIRVKDAAGKVVYETNAMTDSKGGMWTGNYSVKFMLPVGVTSQLTIEALEYSAKDGSPQHVFKVPVTIKNTTIVNRYVALLTSDDCSTVKLYPRQTFYSKEVIFSALSELLRGELTDYEKTHGISTAVPKGAKINSINQTGTTVYVDFNETIESGGGSCSMSGRVAQIMATVKQFLGVNDVVLSVNGKTQGIFQP